MANLVLGGVNEIFTRWARLALALLLVACGTSDGGDEQTIASTQQAVVVPQTVSISVPTGVDFSQVAAAATTSLAVEDRAELLAPSNGFAPSSSTGTGPVTYGYDAKVGSVTALGPITLRDRAKVTGSATSAQTVTLWPNATVTGFVTNNASLTAQTYSWTVPFNTSTTNVTVSTGTTTLAPGSYGAVTVNGGKLVLNAGTYYVDSLTLNAATQLQVNNTSAPVYVYVRTSLAFRTAMTGTPENLLLVYLGTASTALETPFRGTFVAPNASVRLAVGSTAHTGAVFGASIMIDPGVKLSQKSFSRWNTITFQLTPRFECVEARPDGSFGAVFGYVNASASPVTVAVGTNNRFTTGAQNRQQPTTFLPGDNGRAFAVAYTGTALPVWSLNGVTAAANASVVCTSPVMSAVKDATVASSNPTTELGFATELRVGPGEQIVIGFDRAAARAQLGSSRLVRSAKLKLTVTSGTGADLEALPLTQNFSEGGATWKCSNDMLAIGEQCRAIDVWNMARRDGTNENPWRKPRDPATLGVRSGSVVTFDVTREINGMLSTANRGLPLIWAILPRGTTLSKFAAREHATIASRPVLELQGLPVTDLDTASFPPLSFTVDATLPVGPDIPPLADGIQRRQAAMVGHKGEQSRFIDGELLVFTDSPAELAAVKARWNATEAGAQTFAVPGLPRAYLLRPDLTRANLNTLVPNLRKFDILAKGASRVSSSRALNMLAIYADEVARGTHVAINMIPTLASNEPVPFKNIVTGNLIDGPSTEPGHADRNPMNWSYMKAYGVPEGWRLLSTAKLLSQRIDVGIVNNGFSQRYTDVASYHEDVPGCASLECSNSFEPNKPWHGLHCANSGFGMPNNARSTAGPGGPVSRVSVVAMTNIWELLGLFGHLALRNEMLSNSWSLPVTTWLLPLVWGLDAHAAVIRHVMNTMMFAAAGNENANVDEEDCFFGLACWEPYTTVPCELNNVNCVGGTQQVGGGVSLGKDPASSYGWDDVDYAGPYSTYKSNDATTGTDVNARLAWFNGTSGATPFVAGIAALTYAAGNVPTNVGNIEACLTSSSRQVTGFPTDHGAVNADFATRCALGIPSGVVAARIQILSPVDGSTATAPGLQRARAYAATLNGVMLGAISWRVNGVFAGTSGNDVDFDYSVSAPGRVVLEASVLDTNNGGTLRDTVSYNINPAPPLVKILEPSSDNQPFVFGLPVDFLVTETGRTLGLAACDTYRWDAFFPPAGPNPLFTNRVAPSCVLRVTEFPGLGTGLATAKLSRFGLEGTATRSVQMVANDGKPKVKIVSPLRTEHLSDGRVAARVNAPGQVTIQAFTIPSTGLAFKWMIDTPHGPHHTTTTSPELVLPIPIVPEGNCNNRFGSVTVVANDAAGNVASDTVLINYLGPCTPI